MKVRGLVKKGSDWFMVELTHDHKLLWYTSKLDPCPPAIANVVCHEGPFPTIGGMLNLKKTHYFKRHV